MTRFFVVKAWIGGTGLTVGIVGMALERRWVVALAVGLLGLAFALRFAERRA